jgi:hypothetical protein
MRNVSGKSCRKNKRKKFRSITFFENRTVYEMMGKKYCTAGQDTDVNTAHAQLHAG